jgi:cytochrome c oxidase subunit 1
MRCQGMRLTRLPLFVWGILTTSAMVLVATPALAGGLGALFLAHTFGVPFFTPHRGGNVILWQHMFWFYSHPAVYIMILPGFAIISEVIPTFSRKPIFGYKSIAFSSVAIALLSFLVWAHHMFTSGIQPWLQVYFMLATMIIAVPTGIKIFSWIATLYQGKIRLQTPLLFALGFISTFVVGGSPASCCPRCRSTTTCTPPTSWWPTCTTCSSAARSSPSSPACTTGGPRSPGACSMRRWANGTSG